MQKFFFQEVWGEGGGGKQGALWSMQKMVDIAGLFHLKRALLLATSKSHDV